MKEQKDSPQVVFSKGTIFFTEMEFVLRPYKLAGKGHRLADLVLSKNGWLFYTDGRRVHGGRMEGRVSPGVYVIRNSKPPYVIQLAKDRSYPDLFVVFKSLKHRVKMVFSTDRFDKGLSSVLSPFYSRLVRSIHPRLTYNIDYLSDALRGAETATCLFDDQDEEKCKLTVRAPRRFALIMPLSIGGWEEDTRWGGDKDNDLHTCATETA